MRKHGLGEKADVSGGFCLGWHLGWCVLSLAKASKRIVIPPSSQIMSEFLERG